MKEIGEKLKETRESMGISIEEAAEDLKLKPSQLENIEDGNREAFDDIFYLKINRHLISICTTAGIYEKYGSLTDEMKQLSSYHFIRCSQSCIVSLRKITGIQGSDIILANQERIRMSRALTPKVVAAFIMGRCG